MNKQSTTFIQLGTLTLLLLTFAGCKEKTSDPEPVPVVKALNKTTISPKKWFSQGSAFIHDLKAGGVYGTMGGTWAWKNIKSDTLKIIAKSGIPELEWKVYWNTDHEMECERLDQHVRLPYRDSVW